MANTNDVTYARINWEDTPSTKTPINASNLNKMDKGIDECASAINKLNETTSELNTNLDDLAFVKYHIANEIINISSYSSSTNPYITPADGYANITVTSTTLAGSLFIMVNDKGGSAGTIIAIRGTAITGQYNQFDGTVFIKKGTKIYVNDVASAYFAPLVE